MSVASKSSRTAPTRDPAEINGAGGYLTATELQNAWVEYIRRLDKEVWPRQGRTPSRDEVIQLFEGFRLRLLSRAQTRVPKPAVKPPASKQEIPPDDSSRSAAQDRLERLAKYR